MINETAYLLQWVTEINSGDMGYKPCAWREGVMHGREKGEGKRRKG